MANRQPLAMVIRIPGVTLSRSDLEKALGRPLDRYEQRSDRAAGYAQIDIAGDGDQWSAARDLIQSIRGSVQRLVSGGLIGAACLDIAVRFPASSLSTSLKIPACVAFAAGEAGMEIEISVYRTGTA